MRLVAHLQTLHFAFHDRAQTGQLMAYANTDIQQINNVVLLIPLTIASTIQMVAVAVILVLQQPGPRVLRARPRCRCSTSPRPGSATACIPVGLAAAAGALRPLGCGRGERHRRARREGLRRRAAAARRGCAAEADSVYDRSIDQARLRANFMPLIDLLPALGLVGILWYGGHQVLDGHLTRRRHRRRQPLRADADLAAAHGRHAARAAAALGRGGRPHQRRARSPIPRSKTSPHARPLPDGPGEVRFEGVTFGYGAGPASCSTGSTS